MKSGMKIRILIFSAAGLVAANACGGTFLFAESQENPDLITHPSGYTGSENTLSVSVCIATTSESQSDLAIPVQNVIGTWNAFQPTKTNVTRNDSELAFNEVDAESVLLHEVGHCLGQSHPNLANESGVDPTEENYAKTLVGPNGVYDLNDGADNVQGSRDDIRGDDINLNWFRIGVNDPFLFEAEIDLDTYSNDLADLPGGHQFVEIAAFDVSQLRGEGSGEGVMNQLTLSQETQRRIHPEDATTLRIGMSGVDENQGTADDYTVELNYGGIADDCDITIEMTGESFAVCSAGATGISADHFSITTGTITLGSTANVNWFFNSELSGGIIFADRFEQ